MGVEVNMTQELLRTECTLVRNQSELFAQQEILSFMNNDYFPRGWCGLVSTVLGVWLLNKEPSSQFYYVYANKNEQSHAFIKHNNLFIDITADQFDKTLEKVIITKNNEFFNGFKINYEKLICMQDIEYEEESKLFNFIKNNLTT
jgi:hypothetical protein